MDGTTDVIFLYTSLSLSAIGLSIVTMVHSSLRRLGRAQALIPVLLSLAALLVLISWFYWPFGAPRSSLVFALQRIGWLAFTIYYYLVVLEVTSRGEAFLSVLERILFAVAAITFHIHGYVFFSHIVFYKQSWAYLPGTSPWTEGAGSMVLAVVVLTGASMASILWLLGARRKAQSDEGVSQGAS